MMCGLNFSPEGVYAQSIQGLILRRMFRPIYMRRDVQHEAQLVLNGSVRASASATIIGGRMCELMWYYCSHAEVFSLIWRGESVRATNAKSGQSSSETIPAAGNIERLCTVIRAYLEVCWR